MYIFAEISSLCANGLKYHDQVIVPLLPKRQRLAYILGITYIVSRNIGSNTMA